MLRCYLTGMKRACFKMLLILQRLKHSYPLRKNYVYFPLLYLEPAVFGSGGKAAWLVRITQGIMIRRDIFWSYIWGLPEWCCHPKNNNPHQMIVCIWGSPFISAQSSASSCSWRLACQWSIHRRTSEKGSWTHMGKRIQISLGKERKGLLQRMQHAQWCPTSIIFLVGH